MPKKIYSPYHNIEDFTFSMPGGWDDYTISVFLEACHKYVEDLRNYAGDFMRQWSRIVGYGLAMTSNLNCFNITVTMELAKVLKAYLLKNEKTQQYVTNVAFRNLLDDTKELLAYFPNAIESQIPASTHSRNCDCLPSDREPMSVIHVIKHVSKQYRHLFGAKGIPASILWTEISQKVSDKTGAKVDVKQFLEPIKIDIALKVRKEIDSEMKTKKFLALAKDYLAYFDYIPPRSIKKSDFLPPELLDVIVEHDYDVCKTDDAETTEDANQITCNNNSEDFMDVDYVGAYCEVPYSDYPSDNGNPHDTISSEENNEDEEESVCSFMDINSRIGFESVRVEKCEESLCKNLTRYTDPEACILDNVTNGNGHPNDEDETSHVMKSFNNFEESFQQRSEKGDTLIYKHFQHSTDNVSNSAKSYGLSAEDNTFEGSSQDQESYCSPSVMNKYPTVKNDNTINKLVDGTLSYKTKGNLCEYINNTIEPTLMQNKAGSDKCNALNSMQLLPVNSDTMAINDEHESCKVTNYSDWDNNIRGISNADDEMKDGFIRRIAENFGLDNLQFNQSRNKSGNSALHLQKTNCDQIDVFINKDLIEKSSNVLRNLFDATKFNENLLRDTSEEVYCLDGPESGDVFSNSPNNSDKISDSLESLISASRNSSPLTVPDSIQNLMIEDINSNEICDDGLFKRTITDIQETCNNIEEHVGNIPLKEDCTVVQNSSESSSCEMNEKSAVYKSESKNSHLKVNKHKLPRRAKSVDNILHECIKELDNEQSNSKCINAHCHKCSFLKELQEMFFDKKLRENVNPHINVNDINEAHEINCKSNEECQNIATSKEFETGAQRDVNSTKQLAPTHELNASSSESNSSLSDDLPKTTLISSPLHHGNEESDKINSFVNLPQTVVFEKKPIEQGISQFERQITSEKNVNKEKLLEQGVLKDDVQNPSETNVSKEQQLVQSPSEYEDTNIKDITCTCKENIVQSMRKRRLSERRMNISTPLLFKKNRLLYKKKIKMFKRLRSQRKRFNQVHPFIIEEAKMKKLYNLDRNTREQKQVETSDSKDSQSSGQEIQICDAQVKSFTPENVLGDTEDIPSPHKRIYEEDNSSSDDSDTPFYGFSTCNPTRRFKKRKFKQINFNRSDNVGAVLVNNQVVILKKAVVLVRDFIQDISQSLETNPKRHICLCSCAKFKEQMGNSTSENRLTSTHEFNGEDSSRKLNAEISENVPNVRKYLNQTDVLSSSNSVIGEVRDNVENQKRNTLKSVSKENIPVNNIVTWERFAEAVKMLHYYGKNELSASKNLREIMENEQELEMEFEAVFDSVTKFIYRTKRKPCSWYNKLITEYREHLTWKTQTKWKMEKEVQRVEKNKTLIMDKILKLLPKINVD